MEVNVHHAKTHLSRLIAAAEAGEEVIIARNGKPAVKLVLVVMQTPSELIPKSQQPDRILGRLAGKFPIPDDWEKQWDQVSKEVADLMNDGPLTDDPMPPREKATEAAS